MKTSNYLQHYLEWRRENSTESELPALETLEAEYIEYVFELTGYDLIRTADILSISIGTLYKKLRDVFAM